MAAMRLLGLILCSVWLTCGAAEAEKRVALVIGNSAYKRVAQLTNPANDANLVGDMFRKAAFDSVDVRLDLTVEDMRKALRDFGGKARDAEVAVIYYAGHGIELDGTNYLIPTDASLETDADVLDATLPLDRVLFAVEPAKQLRLVILDACRDNPFAKTMKRGSRNIGRGLAKVEPTNPNTVIAFAAKAGSTASDGDAKNSPFATAVVERLPTPGLDLRRAFGFVRDDVLKSTAYKQEPYVYGSLGGDDVPLVPAKTTSPVLPNVNPDIRRDYELALQLNTRAAWTSFLGQYPSGFYADLARGQLDRITGAPTPTAAGRAPVASGESPSAPSENAGAQKKKLRDNEESGAEPVQPEAAPGSSVKTSRASKADVSKQASSKTSSREEASAMKNENRAIAPAYSVPTSPRTCSQTRDNCLADRKRLGLDTSKCAPYFAQCMKTGIWHSGFNHFENVARR